MPKKRKLFRYPKLEKNKNFIYVLEKALKVLEQFSSIRPNLTLTEIEQETGYGPGTTHRILKTLTELGYLRFSDQTRRYSLTFKILNLGFSAISRMEVREIVRPELLSLAETTKQVVSFGILDNVDVVYIDRVQSNAFRLGVDIRIGTRIPTYYTAIGKSILAFLSQEKSLDILKKQELVDPYSRQKIELKKIIKELQAIRKKRWCYTEPAPAIRVLASPILDQSRNPVGAISIAGLQLDSTKDLFIENNINHLLNTTAQLGPVLSILGSCENN